MKRKLLAKIVSALSSLAILATATIPTIPSITPLIAHADYNGGGDANSGGTGNKNGGPGWGNPRASGLRMYVTSPDGTIQTTNINGRTCACAVDMFADTMYQFIDASWSKGSADGNYITKMWYKNSVYSSYVSVDKTNVLNIGDMRGADPNNDGSLANQRIKVAPMWKEDIGKKHYDLEREWKYMVYPEMKQMHGSLLAIFMEQEVDIQNPDGTNKTVKDEIFEYAFGENVWGRNVYEELSSRAKSDGLKVVIEPLVYMPAYYEFGGSDYYGYYYGTINGFKNYVSKLAEKAQAGTVPGKAKKNPAYPGGWIGGPMGTMVAGFCLKEAEPELGIGWSAGQGIQEQWAGDKWGAPYKWYLGCTDYDWSTGIYKQDHHPKTSSTFTVGGATKTLSFGNGMQCFTFNENAKSGAPVDTYNHLSTGTPSKSVKVPQRSEITTEEHSNQGPVEIVKIYAEEYYDPSTSAKCLKQVAGESIGNADSGWDTAAGYNVTFSNSKNVHITDEKELTGYELVEWSEGSEYEVDFDADGNGTIEGDEKAGFDTHYTAAGWVSDKVVPGKISTYAEHWNFNFNREGDKWEADRAQSYKQAYVTYFHDYELDIDKNIDNNVMDKTYPSDHYCWECPDGSDEVGHCSHTLLLSEKTKTLYLLYIKPAEGIHTYGRKYPDTHTGTGTWKPDPKTDTSSKFNIVKCYGTIEKNNFQVEDVATTYQTNTPWLVTVEDEFGDYNDTLPVPGGDPAGKNSEQVYHLMEFVAVSGTPKLNLKASDWCTNKKDSSQEGATTAVDDFANYGFIDNFNNAVGYDDAHIVKSAWKKYQYKSNPEPGAIFIGRPQEYGGPGKPGYSQTIWFRDWFDAKVDEATVYLLFLKEDNKSPEYTTDPLVIHESFLMKRFDFGDAILHVKTAFSEYDEKLKDHLFSVVIPPTRTADLKRSIVQKLADRVVSDSSGAITAHDMDAILQSAGIIYGDTDDAGNPLYTKSVYDENDDMFNFTMNWLGGKDLEGKDVGLEPIIITVGQSNLNVATSGIIDTLQLSNASFADDDYAAVSAQDLGLYTKEVKQDQLSITQGQVVSMNNVGYTFLASRMHNSMYVRTPVYYTVEKTDENGDTYKVTKVKYEYQHNPAGFDYRDGAQLAAWKYYDYAHEGGYDFVGTDNERDEGLYRSYGNDRVFKINNSQWVGLSGALADTNDMVQRLENAWNGTGAGDPSATNLMTLYMNSLAQLDDRSDCSIFYTNGPQTKYGLDNVNSYSHEGISNRLVNRMPNKGYNSAGTSLTDGYSFDTTFMFSFIARIKTGNITSFAAYQNKIEQQIEAIEADPNKSAEQKKKEIDALRNSNDFASYEEAMTAVREQIALAVNRSSWGSDSGYARNYAAKLSWDNTIFNNNEMLGGSILNNQSTYVPGGTHVMSQPLADTEIANITSGGKKEGITQKIQYFTYHGEDYGTGKFAGVQLDIPVNESSGTGDGVTLSGGYASFLPYYMMQADDKMHYYDYNKMGRADGSENNYDNSAGGTNTRAYIIGDHARSIRVDKYMGVSIKQAAGDGVKSHTATATIVNSDAAASRPKIGKLNLKSDQWSTHASAGKITGNGNTLPGGATFGLYVLSENINYLYVNSYVPMLIGSGEEQVTLTGGSTDLPSSIGDATIEQENLIKAIKASIETLNVEQYVDDNSGAGYKADELSAKLKGADGKFTGYAPDGKSVFDTGHLVTPQGDNKYYIRDEDDCDDSGKHNGADKANSGDFDVAESKTTSTVYYTFLTTVTGEVRVIISDSPSKSSILNYQFANAKYSDGRFHPQDLNDFAVTPYNEAYGTLVIDRKGNWAISGELKDKIKDMNDKTHVIDQLTSRLELNTGCDPYANWTYDGTERTYKVGSKEVKSKNDGKWYSEAFDGITIAHIETSIPVGFLNPYERTAVSDPALDPKSDSKGDVFTSYNMSQFRSKDTCNKVFAVDASGKLSAVAPEKDLVAKIEVDGKWYSIKVGSNGIGLNKMFESDIFFIPNVTVQDLK